MSTEPDPAEMELGPNRPDGPAVRLHLPRVQRRAVGAARRRAACATAAASATRTPRTRWSTRRAPPSRRRCGPRSRCSRSAASCCGGSPQRMERQPRTQRALPQRRARGRGAGRGRSAASCTAARRRRWRMKRWPGERRAEDPAFEALLEFLKRSRGLDFTGYKRPSLQRRFRRRMETVGMRVLRRLPGLPRGPPRRVRAAVRDAADQRHGVLPRPGGLGAPARRRAARPAGRARPTDEPVRVWSAGCASGQEAYTRGDGLRRADGRRGVPRAGEDLRHRHRRGRAQPGARWRPTAPRRPSRSRRSCASATSSAPTSGSRSARTSAARSSSAATTSSRDAPISRLDLLICRNTLMYFNAETQGRILRHFHFALHDGGVLMLGKSEMMISHRDLFAPDDLKKRIFVKLPQHDAVSSRAGAFVNGERAGRRRRPREPRRRARARPARAPDRLALGPADVRQPAGPRAVSDLARRPAQAVRRAPARPRRRSRCIAPIEQAMRERRRVTVGEATLRARARRPAAARRHRRRRC